MRNNRLARASAGVILAALLARSAEPSAWNGTWKLNESKSNIPGPSFGLTILPTGEYHSENGTYSFNFRCDGKEYPVTANRTTSCTQTGDLVMDTATKEGGKAVGTAHWSLSPDGKILTIKGTSIEPDGSVKPREKVYSRTFGSTGFVGGWTDTKRLESRPQMVLALNRQTLHIAFSEGGQYMDPPLSGADVACHGRGVPQGLTMAVRPNGPREFLTFKKFQGRVVNEGSLKLSADGRTLVEEYWAPNSPNQKATLVYEKQ